MLVVWVVVTPGGKVPFSVSFWLSSDAVRNLRCLILSYMSYCVKDSKAVVFKPRKTPFLRLPEKNVHVCVSVVARSIVCLLFLSVRFTLSHTLLLYVSRRTTYYSLQLIFTLDQISQNTDAANTHTHTTKKPFKIMHLLISRQAKASWIPVWPHPFKQLWKTIWLRSPSLNATMKKNAFATGKQEAPCLFGGSVMLVHRGHLCCMIKWGMLSLCAR